RCEYEQRDQASSPNDDLHGSSLDEMQNAERRMQNAKLGRGIVLLHSAFCILRSCEACIEVGFGRDLCHLAASKRMKAKAKRAITSADTIVFFSTSAGIATRPTTS